MFVYIFVWVPLDVQYHPLLIHACVGLLLGTQSCLRRECWHEWLGCERIFVSRKTNPVLLTHPPTLTRQCMHARSFIVHPQNTNKTTHSKHIVTTFCSWFSTIQGTKQQKIHKSKNKAAKKENTYPCRYTGSFVFPSLSLLPTHHTHTFRKHG